MELFERMEVEENIRFLTDEPDMRDVSWSGIGRILESIANSIHKPIYAKTHGDPDDVTRNKIKNMAARISSSM